MRRTRWAVAMFLILAMVMMSGCMGRDRKMGDGVVENGVVGDGIVKDIVDGVENGMNTIENDMRTDLGKNPGASNYGNSDYGNNNDGTSNMETQMRP